ncbi:hypothetical protein [Campylobacter mucosalis]|uniref:hypothetical protein n=1 Tax=Campylobacter mucosalis TaxID=202 RepID=UPI0014700F76|nr:hypothetical protein [Campylobacter mucosalis]
MSRYDKILDKISNNPKNMSFDELRAILEYVGFKLVRGQTALIISLNTAHVQ